MKRLSKVAKAYDDFKPSLEFGNVTLEDFFYRCSTLNSEYSEILKSKGFRPSINRNRRISKIELLGIRLFLYLNNCFVNRRFSSVDIIVWSGDDVTSEFKCDFRIKHLLGHLQQEYNYLEAIHPSPDGLSVLFRNFLMRDRPVLYTNAPSRLKDIFNKKAKKGNFDHEVRFWRGIFNSMGVKVLIPWELSSRQSPLIAAAKYMELKIVGFMHGAGMKEYMVHEYLQYDKPIFDVYVVWTRWWQEYYKQNATIYQNLIVGHFDRFTWVDGPRLSNTKSGCSRLVIIEERLSNVDEILIKLNWLCSVLNFNEIVFKPRKGTMTVLRSVFKSLGYDELCSGYQNNDLIVGSHSTAVLEASLFGLNFFLLDTETWGNYFKVAPPFFLNGKENKQEIIEKLRSQRLSEVSQKYFNDNDGGDDMSLVLKKTVDDIIFS